MKNIIEKFKSYDEAEIDNSFSGLKEFDDCWVWKMIRVNEPLYIVLLKQTKGYKYNEPLFIFNKKYEYIGEVKYRDSFDDTKYTKLLTNYKNVLRTKKLQRIL